MEQTIWYVPFCFHLAINKPYIQNPYSSGNKSWIFSSSTGV